MGRRLIERRRLRRAPATRRAALTARTSKGSGKLECAGQGAIAVTCAVGRCANGAAARRRCP
eukprot:3696790-Pyramimonas_sp.AAC.1